MEDISPATAGLRGTEWTQVETGEVWMDSPVVRSWGFLLASEMEAVH